MQRFTGPLRPLSGRKERIEPQQKLEQERVLRRAAAGALGGKLLDYLPEQRRLYAAAGKVPGDGADKLVLIPQLLGAELEKYSAAAKGRAAAEPVAGEGKAQVPGMYPLRLTVYINHAAVAKERAQLKAVHDAHGRRARYAELLCIIEPRHPYARVHVLLGEIYRFHRPSLHVKKTQFCANNAPC